MKKLKSILILFFFFQGLNLNAQNVDSLSLDEINAVYITVYGQRVGFSNSIRIYVDYGQTENFFVKNNHLLKDKDGTPYQFNSMTDALNKFHQFDYELVSTYTETISSKNDSARTYYVLRKMKVGEGVNK